MSLRRTACFALSIVTAFVAPLRAAEDPLDVFPRDAGVLVRLASPTDLADKAEAFLKNAAPQFAGVVRQVLPGLGSLVGNPTLAGVDPARPWYVAVLPRAEGEPAVVFAIPASDAAALKGAVGQGYTFAEHEKWAVYSLDAEAVKRVQARIGGEGESVRGALGGSVGEVFGKGEVAVFLNVPVLRETYKAQIEQAKGQIAAATQAPEGADAATKTAMAYNRAVVDTLLAAIGDLSGIAGHVAIGEQAVTEEAVVAVAPGSASAAFLAKQQPSGLPLFAKLPGGRPAYYGFAGDLSDLIASSTKLTAGLYPQDGDAAEKMKGLREFRFSEIAGLFELGSLESGVYRGLAITKVSSPEKYLVFARDLVRTMGHVEAPGLQQDITLQPEAETVEGVKVDVMKVVMTPDPNADPTGTSRRFMEIFFGKEGMTQRMAVVDGLFVQGVGGSDMMATAIDAARGGAEGDQDAAKAVGETRARLAGEANVLVLVDLPQLIGGAVKLAAESNQIPLPIDAAAIENLEIAPSYVGATVAAAPTEARVRGVIPAEQVRGLVELFRTLQQAGAGRNRGR